MQTFDPTLPEPGATSAIDGGKASVARGIDSAASKLREKADMLPRGGKAASAAYRAADVMETASDYVANRDLREILWTTMKERRKES